MGHQPFGDRFGERFAIHRECAARGQAMGICRGHDQTVCGAHLPMEKTNGVLFVIIGSKRVGAHHLGQVSGLVSESCNFGAHFMDDNIHAHVRSLPGSFGPGHAAADDMKCV